jgi:hypothetical protein
MNEILPAASHRRLPRSYSTHCSKQAMSTLFANRKTLLLALCAGHSAKSAIDSRNLLSWTSSLCSQDVRIRSATESQ